MATRRERLGSAGLTLGALVAGVGFARVALQIEDFSASRQPVPNWGLFKSCLIAGAIAAVIVWLPSVRKGALASAVRRSLGFAVVIVILFAGALPPFWVDREKAFAAQMKSDLRNLAALEDSVHAESGRFTAEVGADARPATVDSIRVSESGWSATAAHPETQRRCAIFVGPRPEPPAIQSGEPACTAAPVSPVEARRLARGVVILVLGLALATAGARARGHPA